MIRQPFSPFQPADQEAEHAGQVHDEIKINLLEMGMIVI
jgi:hypothetical protein